MSEVLMSLSVKQDRLDLYNDRIIRTGTQTMSLLGKGGTKTFFINQISSVQLQKATALSAGWLYFAVPGDKGLLPNVHGARRNANAVLFQQKDNEAAERFKDKIEEMIAAPVSQATDAAEQIRKLSALHDDGILSDAEYESKKAELLAKM